jgi:hypothetical protein
MTQQYVGTKIVTAWESEKDGQLGYGVKYADGYTSWSPKSAFDEAYLALGNIEGLPPHQQRVIAEKVELDNRIEKLGNFSNTPLYQSLDELEQNRLSDQCDAMQLYSEVLADRIAAF